LLLPASVSLKRPAVLRQMEKRSGQGPLHDRPVALPWGAPLHGVPQRGRLLRRAVCALGAPDPAADQGIKSSTGSLLDRRADWAHWDSNPEPRDY